MRHPIISQLISGSQRFNTLIAGKGASRIRTPLCRWGSLLTTAAILVAAPLLTAADKSSKWVSLFDGKTTNGWAPRAAVVSFEAKDGELQILSTKNVWITSDLKMSDFILEAEVKLPEGAHGSFNSGLAFRCIGETGKPKGYQCEIDARRPTQSGGVYAIGLGGWLYPKPNQKTEFNEKIRGVFHHDDWNRIRVRCEGPRIQTWINDTPIADIKDAKSLKGFFGIQHHGKGGTVKFRNLRAKRLK